MAAAEWSPLATADQLALDQRATRMDKAYPFPVARLRVDKYFPPVSRIDGAFGDRNLVCSCPPPEAFAE